MKHRAEPMLLVDVSNSFTKLTIARGARLGRIHRVPTADWTAIRWRNWWCEAGKPERIVVSSVVPRVTQLMRKVTPQAHFLSWRSPLPVGVNYPKPAQIGADRLANAAAACVLYGAPAIVVDFGTAVTFDVVDASGNYVGGVIAPGVDALTRYLHEKTALLPAVTLAEPRRALGRSTVAAMRSGAVLGFRGLVGSVLTALAREVPVPRGATLHLLATGGYASLVARRLRPVLTVNSRLTLIGLRLVADRLP